MSDVQNNLKKYRRKKNMSYSQLAAITGIAKSTLQRYETGTTQKIPMDAVAKIEKAFHLPKGTLIGWAENNELAFDNIFPIETKKIPLLGEISCGEPIFAVEDRESYVEAGSNIKADFCLKCKGDSMINARIYDGDIVFIRKQSTVDNGEIAAIIIDDEATLKRFYYDRDNNEVALFAENPKYKTIRFAGEELNHIKFLGKAIAFQSDVK